MAHRFTLWLVGTCFVLAGVADAAPAKRRPLRRPTAAVAKKSVVRPVAPKTLGIMVPKPVLLVRATPAEARAHSIWMLRAALNVAALQCQYSVFLRTVDNYNQMLRKHGQEVAAAQTIMVGHFTRTVKKGGDASFDRYNTRGYNSFSTLDAQYNFCWAAGQAGLAVKLADVGGMAQAAEVHLPQLRAALALVPPAAGLVVAPVQMSELNLADQAAISAVFQGANDSN
ncbi:hypothetical protein [Sandarakinorhabdus sp.]|uniref:hypothetical protein n=1 Tax=Sandarakinorhabdus sp. TaxID=1916663 RepID=UPI0033400055